MKISDTLSVALFFFFLSIGCLSLSASLVVIKDTFSFPRLTTIRRDVAVIIGLLTAAFSSFVAVGEILVSTK